MRRSVLRRDFNKSDQLADLSLSADERCEHHDCCRRQLLSSTAVTGTQRNPSLLSLICGVPMT
ncbi:MAG: hypothetical protein ACK50J_21530, partial [Planctomyces sp.]